MLTQGAEYWDIDFTFSEDDKLHEKNWYDLCDSDQTFTSYYRKLWFILSAKITLWIFLFPTYESRRGIVFSALWFCLSCFTSG